MDLQFSKAKDRHSTRLDSIQGFSFGVFGGINSLAIHQGKKVETERVT